MMQRAAAPVVKVLASQTFSGIDTIKWQKIENRAALSGIPIAKPSGRFSVMSNTVRWSLVGNALTIDVIEATYMPAEDVLSFVTDLISKAIA